jgi:asparagine synthase (glutamine-hydrolysing)
MCGIFGLFERVDGPKKNSRASRILAASIALSRRGPDDSGEEDFELVTASGDEGILTLGHRRLSVIDLTRDGRQPFFDGRRNFCIVFNGEIYNYIELRRELESLGIVFRTDTDTEVLLAAWVLWGRSCLDRLIGMFSFAIYDKNGRTLTLVRDAFGVKPLYFDNKDGFYFASDLPALVKLTGSVPEGDEDCAHEYLTSGRYDFSGNTFIKGIQTIPPGHLLSVSFHSGLEFQLSQWWFPEISIKVKPSFDEAAGELRRLFLESVNLQLRSDVPVGAALSGGLDSSSIVCAMRFLQPDRDIPTFSYVARNSKFNEEKYIDLVNDYVRARPHKLMLNENDLIEDLEDLILTQGEPFGSTSIYAQYRLYKLARDAGVTVILDGQGADELLCGYLGYPVSRLRSLVDRREVLKFISLSLSILKGDSNQISSRRLGVIVGAFLSDELLHRIKSRVYARAIPKVWFDRSWRAHRADGQTALKCQSHRDRNAHGRRLMERLRIALTIEGLPALLRHADRNSMRWSVESRVPFLTTDLAKFVLSLPEEYLVSADGQTKRLLRASMRGIVPDQILNRRDKVGFVTPESDWIDANATTIFNSLLRTTMPGIFNQQEIANHYERYRRDGKPLPSGIWRVMNFTSWAERFGVSYDR